MQRIEEIDLHVACYCKHRVSSVQANMKLLELVKPLTHLTCLLEALYPSHIG